jgi:prepilin-type N-terminal cleavage/methylation domain-containing protein
MKRIFDFGVENGYNSRGRGSLISDLVGETEIKMARKKEGFTLIELLVVIAIIALLLAILIPALSKAKIYAEEIMCKSNLHQYHLATEMYANDCKSKYPDPWKSLYKEQLFTGELQRYCRWHNPLFSLQAHPEYAGPYWPYLATAKVNFCPSFAKIAPKYGSSHFGSCIGEPFEPQFSYSMNGHFGTLIAGGPVGKENVVSPSHTFLWAEENMWTMKDKNGAWLCTNVLTTPCVPTAETPLPVFTRYQRPNFPHRDPRRRMMALVCPMCCWWMGLRVICR